ncbi:MAG TPA: hypothetical protein DEH78_11770 [Solibacterales bacterium]|nr:hypothetical protein [Bryobacterales bacterium]
MPDDLVPFLWPGSWAASTGAALLAGTPFNCLVTAGAPPTPAPASMKVVSLADAPAVVVKGEWPGVPSQAKSGGGGPTGNPWVDSNAWRIRLAQARNPGRAIWVEFAKPEQGQAVNRLLTLADTAWCGARWIVDIGDELARGLSEGNSAAKAEWERLTRAAAFFERNRARQTLAPAARLGVLSSFEGEDEFLAQEVLNLAARRHLAYRILIKGAQFAPQSLAGLRGVLYTDAAPPPQAVLAALSAFVREGGLLLAAKPTLAAIPGATRTGETLPRAELYRLGKGRIAAPKTDWDDPYLLALDAHLILSKQNDLARLYNPGLLLPIVSGDGRRTVVQMVNFAGRGSANDVALLVQTPFQAATFCSLEQPEPKPLAVQREAGRNELYLPPFSIYAAVELR